MTNRLLLDRNSGAPRMKLSKPGFDVDSAADINLLFDINTGGYGGIFQSGIVPFASFAASSASNFYGYSTPMVFEVTFGKTFATVPKFLLSINDPLLGSDWYGPMYQPTSLGSGTGCQVGCGGEIFNDKFRILLSRVYFSGTLYPYPSSVAYVIFHN
ncbi:MAG: hypothetical protein JWM36_4327 [Hyphomicrobiales bacterium]|nr:hypothetical protein [Hyphomicrobiales bacterium]